MTKMPTDLILLAFGGWFLVVLGFIVGIDWGWLTLLIFAVSAVEVDKDAKKIGAGTASKEKGWLVRLKADYWAVLVFLVWPIFMTLYLIKRADIEKHSHPAKAPSKPAAKEISMGKIIGWSIVAAVILVAVLLMAIFYLVW